MEMFLVEGLDRRRVSRRDVVIAICFLTTAPFFDSASPLSLECRGRDFVCSINNLFNSFDTVWLMNSLPLSE